MADPYNSALPLDSDPAQQAAAELRALKARLNAGGVGQAPIQFKNAGINVAGLGTAVSLDVVGGGATLTQSSANNLVLTVTPGTIDLAANYPWTGQHKFSYNGDPAVIPTVTRNFRVGYTAAVGTAGDVKSAAVIDALVPVTTVDFEWAFLTRLSNYANSGENVAVYGQMYKYAGGPSWAAVFEAQDFTNSNAGSVTTLELNLCANGPGLSRRSVIDIVCNKANSGGAQAIIDYGLKMSPFGGNRANAQLGVAFKLDMDTTDSMFRLDNSAVIPFIFNLATNNVGNFMTMSSASSMYTATLGSQVGGLKMLLNGATVVLPLFNTSGGGGSGGVGVIRAFGACDPAGGISASIQAAGFSSCTRLGTGNYRFAYNFTAGISPNPSLTCTGLGNTVHPTAVAPGFFDCQVVNSAGSAVDASVTANCIATS